MNKLGRLFKFLKIVLSISIVSLIAFSIYNDFQYSQWSSMPAAEVLSGPIDCYQNFLSLSEERSDGFHETFLNLCGKHYWRQLSLSNTESVTFECDSLLGTVRLLIIGSSPDNVVYDDLISATQEIILEAGSYEIYLLGSWFTGSIEMQF